SLATAWWRAGAALGFALTGLVYLQASVAPFPLPAKLDVTLARLGGWGRLGREVEAARRQQGAQYVVADDYGVAALLAWELPDAVPVVGLDDRWTYLHLPGAAPVERGQPGLLVRSALRRDPPESADWGTIAPAGEIARSRRGVVAEDYRLYRITGRAGGPPM